VLLTSVSRFSFFVCFIYRKLRSVLIVAPATMLQHWLKELAVWAPGLRRILIHQSAGEKASRRSISRHLLQSLSKWLERVRADRVNECIDEEDRLSMVPHSFCGTGYVIVTTYENVRRNPDIYIQHTWSYVVLDEGSSFLEDIQSTLHFNTFQVAFLAWCSQSFFIYFSTNDS
jgi:SNF2 family DNA or RNA helicase